MQTNFQQLAVLAGLCLGLTSCVPLNVHQRLQDQNASLQAAVEANNNPDVDAKARGERNVQLALENHRLKIEKADLLRQAKDRDAYYDSVMRNLRNLISSGRIKVTRYGDTIILEVSDDVLFSSGKADLRTDGKEFLAQVAKAIKGGERTIRVVGHTDDEAMATGAAFATNWELSTARATKVVRYFQEDCGLSPERLLAAGRGQWQPVAPNDTPANRRLNRRITISLVDPSFFDGSGPVPAGAAGK